MDWYRNEKAAMREALRAGQRDMSELRTQETNTTCWALLAQSLLSVRSPAPEPAELPIGGETSRVADLGRAFFSFANLSKARNLTQQQLDQVFTCKSAILPQGLTCQQNQ